eukprot:g2294.t1
MQNRGRSVLRDGDEVKIIREKLTAAEAKQQLYVATVAGDLKSCNLVLDCSKCDLKIMDELFGGSNCLHTAVKHKHAHLVERFLKLGANADAKTAVWGYTALHLAAISGCGSLCRLLVDYGADLEAKCNEGKTAFHMAASFGLLNTCGLLLKLGAKARNGVAPLHIAAFTGKYRPRSTAALCAMLIERGGASVDQPDADGCTALHYAAEEGNTYVARVLIEKGANLRATNCDGEDPEQCAAQLIHENVGCVAMVALIRKAKVDEADNKFRAKGLHPPLRLAQLVAQENAEAEARGTESKRKREKGELVAQENAEVQTRGTESEKCEGSGGIIKIRPPATFTRLQWEHPRVQWNINGGFCGSFSLQTLMMTHGAWVSEDLVRKANIGAPCFGHGNGPNSTICMSPNDSDCISSAPEGCEVGPENYAQTCKGLMLDCDVWDYAQPKPQTPAYKSWLKSHLSKGVPIVWVPMLKGASNTPYGPRSCPGGGHFNHHEPVLGIGSNHSLNDTTVYDDDWLVHLSDENEHELVTYYRTFGSLQDGFAMKGNCLHSDPTRSCAYPCFFEQVTYGIAVKGFLKEKPTLPVSIDVDTMEEPDSRDHQKPIRMHANITVRGLSSGSAYILYRFSGFNSFPASGTSGYESKVSFTAPAAGVWRYRDPKTFLSNGAVYYIATPAPAPALALALARTVSAAKACKASDPALNLTKDSEYDYFYAASDTQLRSACACTSIDYLLIGNDDGCPDCAQGTLDACQLESITGSDPASSDSLTMNGCPLISSLVGLSHLTGSLPGGVGVVNMNAITSLDGLEHVKSVGTDSSTVSIRLSGNGNLTSATALSGVSFAPDTLDIVDNSKLACVPKQWPDKDQAGRTIRNGKCHSPAITGTGTDRE